MNRRYLGQTALEVSELGFGCGAVGGLLVRGEYPTMRQTVARAIELGINYFDTASSYGNGQSEANLGAVLRELKSEMDVDVVVGTKVRLSAADMDDIGAAVVRSVDGSLRRLGRERIDLIQLHNRVGSQRDAERGQVAVADLEPAILAFEALAEEGKVRYWGINGLGETDALRQAVDAGGFHTIQCCYNLLNPSAGQAVPSNFAFQDYQQLIHRAEQNNMGVIAIRVLAGGALSGDVARHPVAAGSVAPIATGSSYAEDAAKAQAFAFLVREGYVDSLIEAAIRFAISNPDLSTALVGISAPEHLEQAAASAEKGPLPAEALESVRTVLNG